MILMASVKSSLSRLFGMAWRSFHDLGFVLDSGNDNGRPLVEGAWCGSSKACLSMWSKMRPEHSLRGLMPPVSSLAPVVLAASLPCEAFSVPVVEQGSISSGEHPVAS